MMTADLSSQVAAWATAATALIAAIALGLAWWQVRGLKSQTALSAQAGISQAYGQVLQGMSSIHQVFLEHPDWIPYFYEGDSLPKDVDSKERWKIDHFCETLMDFIDLVVEQRNATPLSGMDWSTWESYFRYVFSQSPVMQKWVQDNIDFYPDYEFAVLGLIIVRDPLIGQVRSQWHAREFDLDEDSDQAVAREFQVEASVTKIKDCYPWLRTWLMECVAPKPGPIVVVAPVVPQTTSHIEVKMQWSPDAPYDDRTIEVLSSWVLGLLTSSAFITSATITTSHLQHESSNKVTRFVLRNKKDVKVQQRCLGLKQQEPFLLPTYLPEHVRLTDLIDDSQKVPANQTIRPSHGQ